MQKAKLGLESMEIRENPSAVIPVNGPLSVVGTMGSDQIRVTQIRPDTIVVSVNSNSQVYSGVTALTVASWAGDDSITTNGLLIPTVIQAGQGNDLVTANGSRGLEIRGERGDDTIYGTAANDLIFGGEGNDRLFGRESADTLDGGHGNDALDGGAGVDRITSGAGNDTIVQGITVTRVFISPGNSSITETWDLLTDADPYHDRVFRAR